MPQRIVYGALAVAIMLGITWSDAAIADYFSLRSGAGAALLSCGSLIPMASALLCLVGGAELVRALRSKGVNPCAGVAYPLIALCILAPWFGAGFACSSDPGGRALYATVFSVSLAMVGTGVALVFRRRIEDALRDAGATILVILYVGLLPSFAVQVRSGVAGAGPDGAWLILVLLLIIKASDIGAYLTGTFLGRHKLIPRISPGKSVEGAIGGLLLSGLAAWLLLRVLSNTAAPAIEVAVLHPRSFPTWFSNTAAAFAFGATMSVLAQIGDLLESCFKRDAGIKDSGQILPRFGGALDIIDSPLLALPVAWMILTLVG